MAAMNDTIGVILAGGRASRMGRDKASVPFLGETMISRVAGALAAAGLEVMVVGRREATDGLTAIPDDGTPGRGPMAGMVTGLRHAGDRNVFLVAVDQPLLRPETVTAMLQIPGDAVVPRAEGHPQVTCAVYRRACLPAAEQAFETGEMKLRRMLDTVDATYIGKHVWSEWGEDGRSWLSLDTPQAVRDTEQAVRHAEQLGVTE